MKIKADEISSVLKKEIENYAKDLEMDEVGTILEVGDGIARIYGLQNAMAGELLEFPHGVMGLVLNLEEASVGAVLLGDYKLLREGDIVKRTQRVMSVPVGPAMVGRVVNPLGEPLDDKGPIHTDERMPLEIIAPGIAARQPVNEPLQTGLKAVDAMIPIGRGQRELIIGDRQTGKTAIAIDAIINQKDSGVICVYVAVGQKASTVVGLVERLREAGAMDYTIVVAANASDPAPLQYIAPYAGTTLAEYFVYNDGAATLCVYDDLSKQAAAYRELSLLLRRPPGREAYPGDVFYLHSRLLERSCKLKDEWIIVKKDAAEDTKQGIDGVIDERGEGHHVAEMMVKGFPGEEYVARQIKSDDGALATTHGKYAIFPAKGIVPLPHTVFDSQEAVDKAFGGIGGEHEVRKRMPSGGSLTALPIIETQEGEVSAYIPTNVISITDGQIYLEPNLFFAGIRPAINVGISVSRVGGNAQTKAMKKVAGSLKLDLASYWDLEAFAQLGTELDAVATRKLERGKRLVELLKQGQYLPLPVEEQVMMVFAGNKGFLDELPVEKVLEFEKKFLPYVRAAHAEIGDELRETGKLSKSNEENLTGVLRDFVDQFKQGKTPDPRSAAKKKEAAKAYLMGNLRDIKRRIKSVKNTTKITRTMELIATAKSQVCMNRIKRALPYFHALAEIAGQAQNAGGDGETEHPLLAKRDVKRVAILAVVANRGLCGGYNTNCMRMARDHRAALMADGKEVDLYVSGKKGLNWAKFNAIPFVGSGFTQFDDKPPFTEVEKVADELISSFLKGEVDQVDVVYTHYHSSGRQYPQVETMLPIAPPEAADKGKAKAKAEDEGGVIPNFIIEPDPQTILDVLFPLQAKLHLFRVYLEAATSEQIFRRVAMKNATDNGIEVGKNLKMDYNRARQSQITNEILEVLGGAEALA